ncbi:MAG: hypothetical protein RLZZ270_622 [Actinomycetota bacterium]|jgi:hypothetical protein
MPAVVNVILVGFPSMSLAIEMPLARSVVFSGTAVAVLAARSVDVVS